MRHFSLSPFAAGRSLWQNLALIKVLTRREIVGRYQGSVLGMLWSFFNPIFMLAVYTFVFSVIFKARWGGGGDSKTEFALALFAGIFVFNVFAECIGRAPALIVGNPTYVKKVIFPLEILPWVSLGAAMFHMAISFIVWLLFHLLIFGSPPLTIFLFPLMLLPLVLFTIGLSWLLASLGVFLRDVSQIIGILIGALMFLTPIFYPVSAIPESYRNIMHLNPLTFIIDQTRDLLIFGRGIVWLEFVMITISSALVAWLGFAWFQKTRKGFADVL